MKHRPHRHRPKQGGFLMRGSSRFSAFRFKPVFLRSTWFLLADDNLYHYRRRTAGNALLVQINGIPGVVRACAARSESSSCHFCARIPLTGSRRSSSVRRSADPRRDRWTRTEGGSAFLPPSRQEQSRDRKPQPSTRPLWLLIQSYSPKQCFNAKATCHVAKTYILYLLYQLYIYGLLMYIKTPIQLRTGLY